MTSIKYPALMMIALLLNACNFKEKLGEMGEAADKQFGDQHFKTAIALIELHKIRFGHYPESIDSIKYGGDWDAIIKTSVKYQQVDSGYSLDLVRGFMGKPQTLRYPDGFWKGLGLRSSNLKK